MKTLTVTLHDSYNCGSSLQAFALQKFLINNNIENAIIDYCPQYLKDREITVKRLIKQLLYHRDIRSKTKKFDSFRKKYLIFTQKRFTTYQKLNDKDFHADCYIAGSDQLWNSMYSCGHDPAYYLDFVTGRKITYAVSVGREIIPTDNLAIIEKYCKNFSWISVREKSSVQQLREIYDGPVDYVCDPVVLNDIDIYKSIESQRIIESPYILVYLAQDVDSKFLSKLVAKVKSKFGCNVVFSGTTYKKRCPCDIQVRDVAPCDFLSLVHHAQCIISNSFHATMFSVLYKKQFYTLIPPENGERIESILDLTNLRNHGLYDTGMDTDLPMISKEQFGEIAAIIADFREKSGNMLLQFIRKT